MPRSVWSSSVQSPEGLKQELLVPSSGLLKPDDVDSPDLDIIARCFHWTELEIWLEMISCIHQAVPN